MEQKLAEYRAKKAKEKVLNPNGNITSTTTMSSIANAKTSAPLLNEETNAEQDHFEDVDEFVPETETECGFLSRTFGKLLSVKFILKFSLWLCLLMFFINIEFGAVYFIVSLTFIMFYSMKNRSRKSYEPSAYSVFNRNFERIDGTFTAEQFERQMIYGGAVR